MWTHFKCDSQVEKVGVCGCLFNEPVVLHSHFSVPKLKCPIRFLIDCSDIANLNSRLAIVEHFYFKGGIKSLNQMD